MVFLHTCKNQAFVLMQAMVHIVPVNSIKNPCPVEQNPVHF